MKKEKIIHALTLKLLKADESATPESIVKAYLALKSEVEKAYDAILPPEKVRVFDHKPEGF